jgi:DNA helicase-2/ATP-dependent DNA helicase PcrA
VTSLGGAGGPGAGGPGAGGPGAGGPGAGGAPGDAAPLPSTLTAAQREAVLAPDPLLCVLAGAGAGKTQVLTWRVRRRIADGSASPEHVLVCTFSRKAADELRTRLWKLGVGEGVRAGTIHRTALSLLRQHRADRQLAPVIVADRRALLAEVLAEATTEVPRRRAGADTATRVDTEIGWAKARMIRPDGYERAARDHGRHPSVPPVAVAQHYRRYEETRRRRGLLDLDDLLTACADTLAEDAPFAEAVRWRFRHLFVDEMQDVNPAQFRLLSALLGDEPDLFVVGDPYQSVYGWNGADPALLDRLPEILVGTRVLRLDENHRSSPEVVAMAVATLGLSGDEAPTSARPRGSVPRVTAYDDEHDEARGVARLIWRAHRPGRSWSGMAVLARTNAQLRAMTEALTAEHVPHRLAGGDAGPASDVAPDGRAAADRDPPDAVTLSTFHRAKGLEWPTVHVIGLSDGLVPLSSARSEAEQAEERRLLYVALTRAEEELSCSWARRREAGVGPERRPSRWLDAAGPTLERLARDARPPGPAEVAAHLAELRARLAAATGDHE